jgi:acyl dehydratase
MRSFTVGEQLVYERMFSDQDVLDFTKVSGDAGIHHVAPGPDGRRLVQGLLTATIPTKLGGDLDYLAREMHFEFLRPVYTGDAIRCVVTIREVDVQPDRVRLVLDGTCTNQHGEVVLAIATRGVVRR